MTLLFTRLLTVRLEIMPTLFLLAAVTFVTCCFVTVVCRLHFHPLAKYPGPWLGRVTSLRGLYHTYKADIHIDMMLCHEKYGPIVRYQPNRLIFNTNKALKDIYGHGKNLKKSAAYHQFPTNYAYSTHNVVDKALHHRKRKLVSHAFSPDSMKIWTRSVHNQLEILCSQLAANNTPGQPWVPKDKEGWGRPQKMSHWCLCLLTDVVMDAVFSSSWRTLTTTENWYMLELVHRTYEWLGLVFQAPKLAQYRLDLLAIPQLCDARQTLRVIFGNILRERIQHRETKGDVYDVYLEAKDPETGEGWPLPELGAEALLLFGAGPDATASSMSAALFYITRNEEVYRKVVQEVSSTFESAQEIMPGHKLNCCHYLRACIEEAQRCNPANGSALWREIDTGGANIAGEQLPAGVDVGVPIYAIHHNELYYSDPFSFKPERWGISGTVTEAELNLAKSAWNPFSLGPRGCVGKAAAMLQLTVTLARIYWQFDVRVPQDPHMADLGCGSPKAPYGRHRTHEFQTRCSFQNSVDGPMLEFRERAAV